MLFGKKLSEQIQLRSVNNISPPYFWFRRTICSSPLSADWQACCVLFKKIRHLLGPHHVNCSFRQLNIAQQNCVLIGFDWNRQNWEQFTEPNNCGEMFEKDRFSREYCTFSVLVNRIKRKNLLSIFLEFKSSCV